MTRRQASAVAEEPTTTVNRATGRRRTAGAPDEARTTKLLPAGRRIVTGSRIAGRYKVLAQLGRGGMGRVYRAHDRLLDRDVAIKVLYDDAVGDRERSRACAREARAAARLNHPGVVRIYDSGIDGGRYFVVMELVEGDTLAELLRRGGPFPPERALDVAAQVADALDDAHGHGIVHCDIKPGNILVDATGRARLVDFGVAYAESTTTNLNDGELRASAPYVAPEQVRGDPVDGRADLYALGIVLYELLVGQPPFVGGNAATVVARRLVVDPPPMRARDPSVPDAVERIVMRMLAREPGDRFATAGELCEALRSAYTDLTTGHTRQTAFGLTSRGSRLLTTAHHPASVRSRDAAALPRADGLSESTGGALGRAREALAATTTSGAALTVAGIRQASSAGRQAAIQVSASTRESARLVLEQARRLLPYLLALQDQATDAGRCAWPYLLALAAHLGALARRLYAELAPRAQAGAVVAADLTAALYEESRRQAGRTWAGTSERAALVGAATARHASRLGMDTARRAATVRAGASARVAALREEAPRRAATLRAEAPARLATLRAEAPRHCALLLAATTQRMDLLCATSARHLGSIRAEAGPRLRRAARAGRVVAAVGARQARVRTRAGIQRGRAGAIAGARWIHGRTRQGLQWVRVGAPVAIRRAWDSTSGGLRQLQAVSWSDPNAYRPLAPVAIAVLVLALLVGSMLTLGGRREGPIHASAAESTVEAPPADR